MLKYKILHTKQRLNIKSNDSLSTRKKIDSLKINFKNLKNVISIIKSSIFQSESIKDKWKCKTKKVKSIKFNNVKYEDEKLCLSILHILVNCCPAEISYAVTLTLTRKSSAIFSSLSETNIFSDGGIIRGRL